MKLKDDPVWYTGLLRETILAIVCKLIEIHCDLVLSRSTVTNENTVIILIQNIFF